MPSRDAVIAASQLPSNIWRGVSMRMAWGYRAFGGPPWLPHEIENAWEHGKVPSFEDWVAFRKEVVRLRNKRSREASQYKFNYGSDTRREYMREYMAKRRSGLKKKEAANDV